MALFFEGMPCAVCGRPVTAQDRFFATRGVWLPPSDPFHRFCDAMLHWDCYARMEDRQRFARSYFEFWIESERENPYWWRVFQDNNVLVTVNPDPAFRIAHVHLAFSGTRHEVKLDQWEAWLGGAQGDVEHSIEGQAIEIAVDALRTAAPTAESLLARIDRRSKDALSQRVRAQQEQRVAAGIRERQQIAAHNAACQTQMRQIAGAGAICPHCNVASSDFRISEREGHRSLLICRHCGFVVDPTTHSN